MQTHIHKYKFDSKEHNSHMHKILGYTDYVIGVDSFHIHTFFGISSYKSHTHYFSGFTGLPIKTKHGHIHKMEGKLELNHMHEHVFHNFTEEEVGYTTHKLLNKLLSTL
ncbi:UNVERIFIED_CONTAM: hypothetical protein Cloal_1903 [Acetivibrio alkalicellulosi]